MVEPVPFEERAARTDEYAAALRAFWEQPEPTFSGRFTSFSRAKSYPKPVQPNGIPIVVKMAEMAVKLRRLTGLGVSRAGEFVKPPAEVIEEFMTHPKLG